MIPRAVEVREASLTLPLLCLGVVGGTLLCELLAPNQALMTSRVLPLSITSGLAAGAMGTVVNRVLSTNAAQIIRVFMVALVMSGALTGLLLGLWTDSIGYAMALGILFSLTFSLPFGLVVIAARRVGRARLGSRVDASDRRAVWVVTSGLLAAAAFVVQPGVARMQPNLVSRSGWLDDPLSFSTLFEFGFGLVGMVGLAVMLASLVLDVRALQALRRQATEIPNARPIATSQAATLIADVDFGVGEVAVEIHSVPSHAYRDAGRSTAVYRGDPGLAVGALRNAIWLDASLLATVVLMAVSQQAHDLLLSA